MLLRPSDVYKKQLKQHKVVPTDVYKEQLKQHKVIVMKISEFNGSKVLKRRFCHFTYITSGKFVPSIWSIPTVIFDIIMSFLNTYDLVRAYKSPWLLKRRDEIIFAKLSCRTFKKLLNEAYVTDITAALLRRGVHASTLFRGCPRNSVLISGDCAAEPILANNLSDAGNVDIYITLEQREIVSKNLQSMQFELILDHLPILNEGETAFFFEEFWHKDNHSHRVNIIMSENPFEYIKYFDFHTRQFNWNGEVHRSVKFVNYYKGPRGMNCITGHSFMNNDVCSRSTVLFNELRIARKKKYIQRGVKFHYHNLHTEHIDIYWTYLDEPSLIFNV
jgi:hypothetical protein